MACGMTQCRKTLCILRSQNIQLTVLINDRTQILCLSVHFSDACHACQSFADVTGDIDNGHSLCIFFFASIF